jgi:parallel beta-helix repeat protein
MPKKKYSYKRDKTIPYLIAAVIVVFVLVSFAFFITISPQFSRLGGLRPPGASTITGPTITGGILSGTHNLPPNGSEFMRLDNFEFSTTVSCSGGYCGDVVAIADPTVIEEQEIASSEPEVKIHPSHLNEIVNSIEEDGEASVIIFLKDDKYTSTDYQENNEVKKSAVRDSQNRLLSELTNNDFVLERKFTLTNGVAGKLKARGLKKVMESQYVISIVPDIMIEPTLDKSRPLIEADKVEDELFYTGKGSVVCVVDSGVDYTHPALGGGIGPGYKVLGGYDFNNNDPDPMDVMGHGTHVSGIVASEDSVYRGVAPGANLLASKVFETSSSPWSTIISGIDWCIEKKADLGTDIITMSLGDGGEYTPQNCPYYGPSLENAYKAGIFIDASSGNSAHHNGIGFPACDKHVISVGAVYDDNIGGIYWGACDDPVTYADKVVCFTSRGPNLDTLAPGSKIKSTLIGGIFGDASGTSMASPHAAGLAAILLEVNPDLPPYDIGEIMKKTGDPVLDDATGLTFPRINALEAVKAVGKGVISTKVGEEPFFTYGPNPMNKNHNPCLGGMKAGDSCETSWIINATTKEFYYDKSKLYNFYTLYSSTGNSIKTENTEITIALDPDGDEDGDGWKNSLDCHPFHPEANPGIVWDNCEDGLDNNCDGKFDWVDMDGDGYNSCTDDCQDNTTSDPPICSSLTKPGDCLFPTHANCSICIHPGPEICDDGHENNCNAFIDCEEDSCLEEPECDKECDPNKLTNWCYITKSITMKESYNFLPNGIRILNSGITVDCNNTILDSNKSKSSEGITVDFEVDNVELKNCNIHNYTYGIMLWGSMKSKIMSGYVIDNCEVTNSYTGFTYMYYGAKDSMIKNSRFSGHKIICADIGGIENMVITNNVFSNNINEFIQSTQQYCVDGTQLSKNVTISNNLFINNGEPKKFSGWIKPKHLIGFVGSKDVTVEGNTFMNNDITLMDFHGFDPKVNPGWESIRNKIIGNTFINNNLEIAQYPIRFHRSYDDIVDGNVIINSSDGVLFSNAGSNPAEKNYCVNTIIRNNHLEGMIEADGGHVGYAIQVGSRNPQIYNNTLINVHGGISLEANHTSGSISNNYIEEITDVNGLYDAMEVMYFSGVIENNYIDGTKLHGSKNGGIEILFSTGATVKNNIVLGKGMQTGISLGDSSSNIMLQDNTVNSSYRGLYLRADNSKVYNNIFCQNEILDILSTSPTSTGDDNTCDTTSGWDDIGTSGCTNTCGSECVCNTCDDCYYLIEYSSCPVVKLGKDIIDHSGTCVKFHSDKFNNRVFDCNGHTIDGVKGSYNRAFHADEIYSKPEGITIRNCVLTEWEDAIKLEDSNNITIEGSEFRNNVKSVYSANTPANVINSNFFDSIYGANLGSNALVRGSYFNNISLYAVSIAANSTVESNTILNSFRCINSMNVNSVIKNNYMKGCDYGIYSSAFSSTFQDNNIYSSSVRGIQLTSSSKDNELISNTVCDNTEDINNKGTNNVGEQNACDTGNWKDRGKASCTYNCNQTLPGEPPVHYP